MRGKLVLVPFPFDDLSATRVRPALCLTSPVGPYNQVILAFITSRIPDVLLESDLVLESSNAGFSGTGLRVTSTIRLSRVMTVASNVILRELGMLSDGMVAQVSQKLRHLSSWIRTCQCSNS